MHHVRLKALAAAIAMAAASSSVCATGAVGAAQFASIRHATTLRAGDKVVGALDVAHPMRVAVSLNLRNKAQLDAFVANPHHPNLTPAQFNAMYAPTQEQAQQVADFLRQSGFHNVTVESNRQLVTAEGRADTAASAFRTSLVSVHTHDGRNAYGTSSDVQIPASLQGIVNEVLGLQTVHTFHVLTPVHPNATSGTASAHAPTDFSTIYNAGSTATGATINVGVITSGSMTNVKSDFTKFLSQHTSLGSIPLNVVTVDGGGTSTSGDGEWDLDTQDIAGMAGGVKAFYLYDTSSLDTQPLVDDFNAAVTANVARVINVSIGGCETGMETSGAATGDNIFEQADAQGQTFSISSGDSGADECGTGGIVPSWPADSEYVVAVGGTELYTSGTTWTNETVWNNLNENEGATGGSPSTFEPQPSWQSGVGQNAGSKYRGLPDVAFDASPDSGANVIVDGSTQQIGGTSLASPLFVGTWARVLATKSSLGFAAPLIYADAASHYSTDFHDVTSGNNSGETAAVGWDYTTGFGSINIANFVANVAGSGGGGTTGTPVANFTDSVSGLTATFTNTSTDTGGTISGYSWSFGDGSTSTSASPSHTYTAAGTYTVSLTVTDSTGATNTKSGSVTVTSGGGGTPTQVLGNTGFETGTASPWSMSSGTLCNTSSSSASYCGSGESSHAGSWFAWLDGYGTSHTDTVSQKVTIPSGHTTATLQYYLHIDTTKSSAVDTFTVQVLNSSGTVLATVGSFTNANKNTGYAAETANLSAYIGQTVTIKFTGKETSSSGNTDFTLDDVTLNVQ
ncbi:protease pro-enzyme activation domain-containing protein [Rhodanobacter sp. DHG33]|uniref:protease pro-enzyme activation domain-containing protein n=1 Tax=Rhodanobacter sp. DHG33 TaxID=2775921 RepID=UPI001784036D|nr:protease pro-enzyme activation domain-containing protein [Rhodanobacter sp. DHG33]MBD8897765.1 PKD domain-containing protein [Rhodanobacter sp. DHG33]